MNRYKELKEIFAGVPDEQIKVAEKLIEEVIFLEETMKNLKKMPFVKIHPEKPDLQKTTPAAKLYKECMQSYMNAIRILLSIVKQSNSSEEDALIELLKGFQ